MSGNQTPNASDQVPWETGGEISAQPRVQWEHHLRQRVGYTDRSTRVKKELVVDREMKQKRTAQHFPEEIEEILDEPGEKTAPMASPRTESLTLLKTLFTEFRTLCESLEQQASPASSSAAPASGPRRKRPLPKFRRMEPRPAPVEVLPRPVYFKPATLMKPSISARRLYFSCPACRHRAVLPASFAGKECRCPRCYSPIVAPDPGSTPGKDLSRCLAPILRPDSFLECRDAHKRLPWLGVRIPKLHGVMQACGALVLSALVVYSLNAMARFQRQPGAPVMAAVNAPAKIRPAALASNPAPAVTEVPTATVAAAGPASITVSTEAPLPDDLKERATSVVEAFLIAEGADAKAPYVRDPVRVLPLMREWYAARSGGAAAVISQINVSGAGFYGGNAEQHPFSEVQAELKDGTALTMTVEHRPEGDVIEWESSVGYTGVDWDSFTRGGERTKVRLLAALDDYPNYRYSAPEARDSHVCVALFDPHSREKLGYGYLPKSHPSALQMQRQLLSTVTRGTRTLRPVMLDLKAEPDARETKQVEIVRFIQTGWREHPTQMLVQDMEDGPVTAFIR